MTYYERNYDLMEFCDKLVCQNENSQQKKKMFEYGKRATIDNEKPNTTNAFTLFAQI